MANPNCIGTGIRFGTAALILACVFTAPAQEISAPLRQVKFIENKGQLSDMQGNAVPFVFFKAGAPGVDLYVTDKGLTYSFFKLEEEEHKIGEPKESLGKIPAPKIHEYEWEVVNLELKGADIRKENVVQLETQQGEHHYYTERFPNGTAVVREYGKLIIKNVYPGIDWVLYNTGQGGFKYDFIVHPGADANKIRIAYTSRSEAKLNRSGDIEVKTRFGSLREDRPLSYLQNGATPVNSSFRLISQNQRDGLSTVEFGVNLESRARGKGVVIDPQLTWSTYFGGNNYEGTMATEVDANGNLFTCGYGASANFPYLNAGTYFEGTGTLTTVSFILKFSSTGVLLWSTNYSGVSGHQDMAVDNSGNIFITGSSYYPTMPVQNNSTYFQPTLGGGGDAYILKFDNTGNRLWATYFGGGSYESGQSVATDLSGNVFLVGTTTSTDFPLVNANTYFLSTIPDDAGFISKFNNSGTLLWSTYYPGFMPTNASTDNSGNLLVTGTTYTNFATQNPGSGAYYQSSPLAGMQDAAVVKFTNAGSLTWATFFGGSNYDYGHTILPDKNGKVYLLGTTTSTDMPVQNAGGYYKSTIGANTDIYIARFSSGGALEWSTFYGSNFSSSEMISTNDNLAVDSCGNVYASFEVYSSGLPVQASCDGGYLDNQYDSSGTSGTDLYIVRFNSSTQISWASYLGGVGYDFRSTMAVDQNSKLFVTGEWVLTTQTVSTNYPLVSPGPGGYIDTTHNGYDDIYIMRFAPGAAPQAFTYNGPYCASVASVAVATNSLGTGGTFSASSGMSVNPTTGVIYPNGAAAGIYTISYSSPNSACSCAQNTFVSVSTSTVQILAGPSLSVAGNSTPCIGQVATRTVSGAQSYTWSTGFQATIFSAKIYSTTVITVTGTAQNSCTSVYIFTINVKGCAGLDEEVLPGVKVYPNPNSGSFIVEALQPTELVLVNMLGQHVRKIRVEKEQLQVEIKDLPPGVYFLKDTGAASGEGLKVVVN